MKLRKLSDDTYASFIPVMMYLTGLAVFGFIYWLLDGIEKIFVGTGLAVTGDTYDILMYLWLGIIVVYVLFGGIWVIRSYNEREQGGYY